MRGLSDCAAQLGGVASACWGSTQSFRGFLASRWFLALGWYSAGALLLLAAAFLGVTCMLQRRMYTVLGPGGGGGSAGGSGGGTGGDQARRWRFWRALCRMNLVILSCCFSFVVRAALTAQLLGGVAGAGPESGQSPGGRTWSWLLYEEWLPAAVRARLTHA